MSEGPSSDPELREWNPAAERWGTYGRGQEKAVWFTLRRVPEAG